MRFSLDGACDLNSFEYNSKLGNIGALGGDSGSSGSNIDSRPVEGMPTDPPSSVSYMPSNTNYGNNVETIREPDYRDFGDMSNGYGGRDGGIDGGHMNVREGMTMPMSDGDEMVARKLNVQPNVMKEPIYPYRERRVPVNTKSNLGGDDGSDIRRIRKSKANKVNKVSKRIRNGKGNGNGNGDSNHDEVDTIEGYESDNENGDRIRVGNGMVISVDSDEYKTLYVIFALSVILCVMYMVKNMLR